MTLLYFYSFLSPCIWPYSLLMHVLTVVAGMARIISTWPLRWWRRWGRRTRWGSCLIPRWWSVSSFGVTASWLTLLRQGALWVCSLDGLSYKWNKLSYSVWITNIWNIFTWTECENINILFLSCKNNKCSTFLFFDSLWYYL